MCEQMDISNLLPIIRSQFAKLKIPTEHDRVFKDECILSFDSPFSTTGLYVNLSTFVGVGIEHLQWDSARSGCKLYLQLIYNQIEEEKAEVSNEPITRLAIGGDGGFANDAVLFTVTKEYFLLVIGADESRHLVPFPNLALPEFVSNIITSIIDHMGMRSKILSSAWDASNDIFVSKYAVGLNQLDNDKKISNNPGEYVRMYLSAARYSQMITNEVVLYSYC